MGFKPLNTAALKEKLTKLEKESKERSFGSSDINWAKLPIEKSKTWIRFLPPVGKMGDADTGKLVWTHFQIPSNEVKHIKCFQTYEMECPLCKILAHYKQRFDVDNWEASLATKFNVLIKRQQIADQKGILVDQKVENPNDPKVLSLGGDYNLIWLDKEISEGGNLLNPMNGNDVIFERISYKGKFERRVVREATPLAATEDEINQIADKAQDLEELFSPPDEKYHKMMQTAVAAIQKTIEEKLMPLGGQSTAQMNAPTYTPPAVEPPTPQDPPPPPAVNQQPVSQPVQTPVQQTPPPVHATAAVSPGASAQPQTHPEAKPLTNVPPNAPSCFGQVAAFYAGDNKNKCQLCHVEFDCRANINSSHPGHIEQLGLQY